MMRIIISTITGIVAGLALAYSVGQNTAREQLAMVPPPATIDVPNECYADENRDAQLVVRDNTEALLQEIVRLEEEVRLLSAGPPDLDPFQDQDWFRQVWADLDTDEPPVDRRQQLVDSGFGAMRADWIMRRESELEQAATEAGPIDHLEARLQMRETLRGEIGDYEYEQYLAATGQSTTVAVTQVLPQSAAQQAGLQIGDEIMEYDGTRVFNVFELSDAAGDGSPDEFVVVNVQRDGSPMQLVLPRGSLGISAGRPILP